MRAAGAVLSVVALALGMTGGPVKAVPAVPAEITITASFQGFVSDRVSPGEVLSPNGADDAVYAVNVGYAGSHSVTRVSISAGGSVWDTIPGDGFWIVGVTGPALGAAFLNTETEDISTPFTDTASYLLYMADDGSQAAGNTFYVEVCAEDGLCDSTEVTTGADADGDGWHTPADCDDANDAVNPAATEVPDNSVDEDCDGVLGTTPANPTWYPDTDGDGYGNPAGGTEAAEAPTGYVADNTDCNDGNENIHPGAGEALDNGVDEDCDGFDLRNWWADADGDTYGNGAANATGNAAPTGYVGNHSDCNDGNENIHPGASEIVGNGVDEDCDGADLKTWYADGDGDTYGTATTTTANTKPAGYASRGGDCDDADPGINPGATDVPWNGVDEDCGGADDRDWFRDGDGDFFGDPNKTVVDDFPPIGYRFTAGDCNDADAAINPSATEIADNGVDEDCDGFDMKTWHPDSDSDSYGDPSSGVPANTAPSGYILDGTDCDDANPDAYPGATETANNGVDEDCDGADLVVSTNNAPTAQDDTATTDEGVAKVITLTGSDPDDDDLVFTVTGGPSNGTLGSVGAADCTATNVCTATVTYTPGPGYSGGDVFTFTVTDPDLVSASTDGTVTVTVNPAPPAGFGPVTTSMGYFTNKGTEVAISSTLLAGPACLARRTVTVTISGGTLQSPLVKTAKTNTAGGFAVKATLQPGTYSVALSTPAVGDCAAVSSDPAGSFVIKAVKKPR